MHRVAVVPCRQAWADVQGADSHSLQGADGRWGELGVKFLFLGRELLEEVWAGMADQDQGALSEGAGEGVVHAVLQGGRKEGLPGSRSQERPAPRDQLPQ